jgi:hypothetical protein
VLPDGEERGGEFEDHGSNLEGRRLADAGPRHRPRHAADEQHARDDADQRAVPFDARHGPPDQEADEQIQPGEIAELIVQLRHDGGGGEEAAGAEDHPAKAKDQRNEAEDEEGDLEGLAHGGRVRDWVLDCN